MDETLPAAANPNRYVAVSQKVMSGDVIGAVEEVRKATEVPVSDPMIWGMIWIGIIYAVAALLKQVQPVAQPFANALAERVRTAPERPADPAAKTDPD